MTTAARLASRPVVDPMRWPDLAASRRRVRRTLQARAAERLFRAVVGRLPVRVELRDESGHTSVLGAGARLPGAPLMEVHQPEAFFAALGADGLIGFGESYMAGDWDAADIAGLLEVFAARISSLVPRPLQWLRALYVARRPRSERNTTANARANVARHYDLSNDLFATFLDRTLSYSSALFEGLEGTAGPVARECVTVSRPTRAPLWEDLAAAQERKIDRILDAAAVAAGSRVLEIGTGWGGLAIRAAQRGATVTSVTLSSEQQALASRRVADEGLSDRVTVELLDYRLVRGQYDAVVSVEMVEAVGHEFWPEYFQTLDRVLAPGGRAAIQAITMPHDRMLATRYTYTWINKYIFPGGFLPSTEAIEEVTRTHTSLRVAERLSFGQHYGETLRLWDERFLSQLMRVRSLGFDEVFHRMWHFYLEYSRAGFRSGYLDVQQFTLTREARA